MYRKFRSHWRVDGKRVINGRAVRASDPGAVKDEVTQFIGYFVKVNYREFYLGKTKEKAKLIEAKLKSQYLEAKRGVPNYLVYHNKPISELIEEYFSTSKVGGCLGNPKTEKQSRRAKLIFDTVISGKGWVFLKDLNSSGLIQAVGKKLEENQTHTRGKRFGKKTANHWIGCWIAFGKWLEGRNYVLKNLFSDVKKFSERELEMDRRLVRRRFSDEELAILFEHTPSLNVRLKMTGLDRAMLYKFASITGFRVGEIASLKPENFVLDQPIPVVKLHGRYAKNGKTVEQVLLNGFVPELQKYLAGKASGKPVWDISGATQKTKLVRVLRRDFGDIKAKIPEQASGLFQTDAMAQLDFHSLRTTFSTNLSESLQSSVLKRLARHSDIRTTDKFYIKHESRFLHSQLESALGGKMGYSFLHLNQRDSVDLKEPKVERAFNLFRKILRCLNPMESQNFMKKLGFSALQENK